MRDFGYLRVSDPGAAVAALARHPTARVIAGGTDLVTLLKTGIAAPDLLVDINPLGLDGVDAGVHGLRIGALARLSAVAADPVVVRDYPVLAQALELSASPQLRNMATIGGNLMQRTRCPYFRAGPPLPCNKNNPGSGCAADGGDDRAAAVFGRTEHCRATHPSDLAVALTALDARVHVLSPRGERTYDLADFYRPPPDRPDLDTVLADDELITEIEIPATPVAARSHYLKLRERASYEFALVSAAAAVELSDRRVTALRLALGGVAARPWRLPAAERAMAGTALTESAVRAAVEPSFADAEPSEGNAFKVELAKRAAVRAVLVAGGAK